jgi:tetraprenyl-beta-curcumene synthase
MQWYVCGLERRVRPTDAPLADTPRETGDPAPISPRQLWALARAAIRELVWGLPAVACEVSAWRTRALSITDPAIRGDALTSLARKRGNVDGAALFWTIPRERNPRLLTLLASYEVICDFLDSSNEPSAAADPVNGRQLHCSLVEALDLDRSITDYYRYHLAQDDGGYLKALVESCRARCSALPSYEHARELLIPEATRFEIVAINHDPNPERREAEHRAWAAREFPGRYEALWFELTAAATASLTIHVLLALSAEKDESKTGLIGVRDAYFPWITLATTMLDHLVDQTDDLRSGDHSYIAYYASTDTAARRIQELIRRCLHETSRLEHSERHTLIVTCMVAMYLSKDSARTEEMHDTVDALADAGGTLTHLLVPILRLWRIAYAQRST